MKKIYLIALLLLFTFPALAQEGKIKIIYVADSKIACEHNNTMMACYKIKSHPDSNWSVFPYPIEGFTFEPGIEAKIEIKETAILFPEENGPQYTYQLLNVLEKRNTVLTNIKLLGYCKYKLINLEKDFKLTPARKANANFSFIVDSGRLGGFGGCNSFGGNAQYEDGSIQFGNIDRTLLSCVNDDIENMLMEGMKGKAAFYVRNNMLFIVCEDHLVMHLRPEKRLDSFIHALSNPEPEVIGNVFSELNPGYYQVSIPEIGPAGMKQVQFTSVKLSETEKKTIRIKMICQDAENEIQELHILLKTHPAEHKFYAILVMKDGTQKSIDIINGK